MISYETISVLCDYKDFIFIGAYLNAGLISIKPMLQLWMAAPYTLGLQMGLGSTLKQVCGVPLDPTPPYCILFFMCA